MHLNELYVARISLDRQRELLGTAERERAVRSVRARRKFHARSLIASWLVRWAHRLDPDVARNQRTPHATA